jgi:hypothetical protein
MLSLAQLIKLYTPFIYPHLISEACLRRMEAFIFSFSHELASRDFYFEHILNQSARTPRSLDFIFSVYFSDFSSQKFSELLEVSPLLKKCKNWMALNNFLKEANGAQFLQEEAIDHLSLEFDFNDPSHWPPQPNVHIPISENRGFNLSFHQKLKSLFNLELSEQVFRNLTMCCASARLFHLNHCYSSLMLGRTRKVSRLNLIQMQPNIGNLEGFLQEIGHQNKLDLTRSLFKEMLPFLGAILLQVDVGEEIGKRIGFELHPKRNTLKEQMQNTQQISELLHQAQLLSEQDLFNLMQWMGAREEIVSAGKKEVSARSVNHLKIVLEENQIVLTKAYFKVTQATVLKKPWPSFSQELSCTKSDTLQKCRS